MFSGLKSIIFGYSESDSSATLNANQENTLPTLPAINEDDTTASNNSSILESLQSKDGQPQPPTKQQSSAAPVDNNDLLLFEKSCIKIDNNDPLDPDDVDDSWYVIPPPCFTGSDAITTETRDVKPKEAARENDLIEHPSIYIASTSQEIQLQEERAKAESVLETATELCKTVEEKDVVDEEEKDEEEIVSSEHELVDDEDSILDIGPQEDEFPQLETLDEIDASGIDHHDIDLKEINSQEADAQEDIDFAIVAPTMSQIAGSENNENESSKIGSTEMQSSSTSSFMAVYKEQDIDEPNVINEETPDNANANLEAPSKKRVPIQVRPIERERTPGWQLRKKRAKRRPLSASVSNTGAAQNASQAPNDRVVKKQQAEDTKSMQSMMDIESSKSGSSNDTSARSSPSLIDRIGSSIVANLTNLTSGIPVTQQLGRRHLVDSINLTANGLNGSVAPKQQVEPKKFAQRRLSKSAMSRQNDCVKVASSNRRSNRRLKMATTPSGCSVNRKVQTSF